MVQAVEHVAPVRSKKHEKLLSTNWYEQTYLMPNHVIYKREILLFVFLFFVSTILFQMYKRIVSVYYLLLIRIKKAKIHS